MKVLNPLVGTPLSEALGWTLFRSLWQGAIIAAALAALFLATRSPRIRYAAGCFALLAMLVSFAITLTHFLPLGSGGDGTGIKPVLPPLLAIPSVNGNSGRFPEVIPLLAPLWLVGVCLFYLRYALGWLSSYKMRSRGVCQAPGTWQSLFAKLRDEVEVSRPVVLLESLLADSPVVLGHFRPVVLVPLGFLAGMPPAQVEAILLHELAHIRRSDYLVNVFQGLVEGLFFYHPAVWWISRAVRAERENCCDDVVVDLKGDAHGYAVALTALEQNRLGQQWSTGEPAVAASGGNLIKRIRRLLYPKSPSGIWAPALAVLVLLATGAMLRAAWQASPSTTAASERMGKQADSRWQKWLNEDVVYIISKEERTAFEGLKTDEEREHFVEVFWARRNPAVGASENSFKEEHYRRIAYANEHWTGALPGWKTDRGRVYIMYGPPDEIDSHRMGGSYKRPEAEGGGYADTYPFEDWRYVHFQGVGSLDIEFVDSNASGELQMTLDPNEKYRKH